MYCVAPNVQREGVFMLRLFRCEIFFVKCFSYFSVFGMIENNSQTENIFNVTKKASLVLENGFHFYIS
jgi:hypothetical protein